MQLFKESIIMLRARFISDANYRAISLWSLHFATKLERVAYIGVCVLEKISHFRKNLLVARLRTDVDPSEAVVEVIQDLFILKEKQRAEVSNIWRKRSDAKRWMRSKRGGGPQRSDAKRWMRRE